jgi:hypothetical protein
LKYIVFGGEFLLTGELKDKELFLLSPQMYSALVAADDKANPSVSKIVAIVGIIAIA